MTKVYCDSGSCKYECNGECLKDMIYLCDDVSIRCNSYKNVFGINLEEEEVEE